MTRWIASRLPAKAAANAEPLARMVNGILHDVALRIRVGESPARLRELGRDAARILAASAAGG